MDCIRRRKGWEEGATQGHTINTNNSWSNFKGRRIGGPIIIHTSLPLNTCPPCPQPPQVTHGEADKQTQVCWRFSQVYASPCTLHFFLLLFCFHGKD